MHGNGDEPTSRSWADCARRCRGPGLTFVIATLAITGIVPLSGLLLQGRHPPRRCTPPTLRGYPWVRPLGLRASACSRALCTAFYMTRALRPDLRGRAREGRAGAARARERLGDDCSRWWCSAVLAVVGAGVGLPGTLPPDPVDRKVSADGELPRAGLLLAERAASRLQGGGSHEEGSPWPRLRHRLGHRAGRRRRGVRSSTGAVFPSRAGQPLPACDRGRRRWARQQVLRGRAVRAVLIIRPIKRISHRFYKVVDAVLIDGVAVRRDGRA